jgi:hypothetical protein
LKVSVFIIRIAGCTQVLFTLVLNRPLPKPQSMIPTDLLNALERKSGGTVSRDQQVST